MYFISVIFNVEYIIYFNKIVLFWFNSKIIYVL